MRWRLWVSLGLLAMWCFAAPGCISSTYSRLVDEDDIPELAALKQQGVAHANHTALVPTASPKAGAPPVRIAIHQIGNPGSGRILVFIHGTMADHTAWRFLTGALAGDYALWLIDLPGCGDSDKPDPKSLGPTGYSPTAMAGRVLEALTAELAQRPPEAKLAFVAHSLGGAVALRMFADEQLRTQYASTLARADRLILLAPLDVLINHQDPTFLKISRVTTFQVDLGLSFGVIRERVAAATIDSVPTPDRALREEADKRIEFLADPAKRRALQAILRQAVAWRGNHPDWDANEAVASYGAIDVPTLIIWGARDETLPCSMGYKLASELPSAAMVCLPRVMHSPQIEAPQRVAGLIRDFMQSGKPPAKTHAPAPS